MFKASQMHILIFINISVNRIWSAEGAQLEYLEYFLPLNSIPPPPPPLHLIPTEFSFRIEKFKIDQKIEFTMYCQNVHKNIIHIKYVASAHEV